MNQIKYLVLTIERELNWAPHITQIKTRLLKTVHGISKSAALTWGLNFEVLSIIYKAAIQPTMTYGIEIWNKGLSIERDIKKLESVQRMLAIKIIKGYRTISFDA